MGPHSADLSAGFLMLPGSRRITELLLRQPGDVECDQAIKFENNLKKASSIAVPERRAKTK